MIKTHTETIIEVRDWNNLVEETYGKPYSFQQQNGCQMRQHFPLVVPEQYTGEKQMHDDIPIKINGVIMGVKFDKWLETDPDEFKFQHDYETRLFWERNFYPNIYTVANDLHKRGLIEEGEYLINIDW